MARPENFGFGSKRDDVETPEALYKLLDKEFKFNHDPCPLGGKDDPKVPDALKSSWKSRNFINPPFSNIQAFLKKGVKESQKGRLSVFLIPARVGSKYWAKYVWRFASQIRFIQRGIQFKGYKSISPFPVAIVTFKPYCKPRKNRQASGKYKWTEINL